MKHGVVMVGYNTWCLVVYVTKLRLLVYIDNESASAAAAGRQMQPSTVTSAFPPHLG